MTLLEIIVDAMRLGYGVNFERDVNMFRIETSYCEVARRTILPLDHLTETKLVEVINFDMERLQELRKNKQRDHAINRKY